MERTFWAATRWEPNHDTEPNDHFPSALYETCLSAFGQTHQSAADHLFFQRPLSAAGEQPWDT